MNILLLGSGGREHALAWKLTQSRYCSRLFIAPGNPGTATLGTNIPVSATDFDGLKAAVLQHEISMVVSGPETPLVEGMYDRFAADAALAQVKFIGPSALGARLEGSKSFAKAFMLRHHIPTAAYREFTRAQEAEALAYIQGHSLPIVLKADGLAGGKGVVICSTHPEALEEYRLMSSGKFGEAAHTIVIEAFLRGIEFSVFVLTDGLHYKILPTAKDYKRIGEGDEGPNTGGMGAVSPLPFVSPDLMQQVEEKIIRPTIHGLRQENITYTGFIYIGLMLVEDQAWVIEYNCRMGDPETQVVMPCLRNDLAELFIHLGRPSFDEIEILHESFFATTIVLASRGYPGKYEINKPITIDRSRLSGLLFHAGTKQEGQKLLSSGGRVINITATGSTLQEAMHNAGSAAGAVDFENKYFRRDIGADLLKYCP